MAIVSAISMSEAASPEAAFPSRLSAEGSTPSPGDFPSLAALRRLPFTRADRLSSPLAAGGARCAQRQLEWAEDPDGANLRPNLARRALVIAEKTAVRADIVAAAEGSARHSHVRDAPKAH